MDVTFHLHADRFAYTAPDRTRIVEAGVIDILVGTSSAHLPCRITVRLTGNTRPVGHDRILTTPVEITALIGDPETPLQDKALAFKGS